MCLIWCIHNTPNYCIWEPICIFIINIWIKGILIQINLYMWYYNSEVNTMRIFPFRIFEYIFKNVRWPRFNISLGIPFLLILAYLGVTVLSVLFGVHMHKKTKNKIWLFLSGVPSVLFIILFILSRIIFFRS